MSVSHFSAVWGDWASGIPLASRGTLQKTFFVLSHSGFFAPISFAQASLAQIWAQKNRMICIIRFSAVRGGFFLRHSPGAPAGTLQRQKSFGFRLGFLFLHHPPDCKEACISCIMQKKSHGILRTILPLR